MDRKTAAVLLACLLLLVAVPVMAYEIGGGSQKSGDTSDGCTSNCDNGSSGTFDPDDDSGGTPSGQTTRSCTNGEDDDGDALADKADPGCVRPYSEDQYENSVYDLDASFLFSGESSPTGSGPSFYYGWKTVNATGEGEDETAGSEADEVYVDQSYGKNTDNWGGGLVKSNRAGNSDTGSTTSINSPFGELIDVPWDAASDGGSGQCGDGIRDSNEDNLDCPEDMGLPDDVPDGEDYGVAPSTGTKSESSNTISDSLSNVDSSSFCTNCGESDDTTSDNVQYDMDLEAKEFAGGDGDGPSSVDIKGEHRDDLRSAVSGEDEMSSSDFVAGFEDNSWSNVPDFYLSSEPSTGIKAVYVKKDGRNSIGTVEAEYLIERTVDDYDGTSHSGNDGCSGSDCSSNSDNQDGCKSSDTTNADDTEYKLNSKTETLNSWSADVLQTSESRPGYSDDTNTKNDVTLDVTYNHEAVAKSSDASWTGCSGSTTGHTLYNCPSGNLQCNETGSSITVYESTDYTYNDDHSSQTVTFNYENLKLEDGEVVFDTNPSDNPHSDSVNKALFDGDSISNGDDSSSGRSNIQELSDGGRGYFSMKGQSDDGKDQGNDHSLSISSFKVLIGSDSVSTPEDFRSYRDSYSTFDADGKNGHGDGFVAIKNGNIVGATNSFLAKEIKDGTESGVDFVGNSDVPSSVLSCPVEKCVASVDVSLNNLNGWSSTDPNSGLSFHNANGPHSLDSSLGACMMYKKLSGDDTVNCMYDHADKDDTPSTLSPTPPSTGACGDEANEQWAYMEGPAINENTMQKYPGHYEGCIQESSSCIHDGDEVKEGTVMNVERPPMNDYNTADTGDEYEESPTSGDWEVCLDIPGQGDDAPGDNKDGTDNGGEWYDLDDESVNNYLGGSGSGLVSGSSDVDSNGDGVFNASDVDFYYRENPNPHHSTYNDGGGEVGLALEDDCDSDLSGCDDSTSSDNLFYSPAPKDVSTPSAFVRDEDYHPQSEDSGSDHLFFGKVKKLRDRSNQLENDPDRMNTEFAQSSITHWTDSDGSVDSADQFAYVDELSETISNRGNPYDTGATSGLTYFHPDASSSPRSSPDADSVPKTDKVFGNSLAVEAATDLTADNGDTIPATEGYWMDPDNIKSNESDYQTSDWKDLLQFNIDITGPDSGLGFDQPSLGFNYENPDTPRDWVVRGSIYFEGEEDNENNDGDGNVDEGTSQESYPGTDQVGETSPFIEPPMCGDDQKEFLVEEMGESIRSAQFDGRYACVDSRTSCVTFSGPEDEPPIVEEGSYLNAGEPDEDRGRLKDDREVCLDDGAGAQSKFWDQDYGDVDNDGNQETCRDNTLYGSAGRRWITSSYVKNHPHAVTGGIDDDWNAWLKQQWESNERENYTFEEQPGPWNMDRSDSTSTSPVPTGSPNRSVATLGFCGGDDGAEYLVTQQCNTQLCQTDTSVLGVADNPGNCILDGSQYPQVQSSSKRDLYDEGDKVEFRFGPGETREIACFNGKWYDKWPIVFQKDNIEVETGKTVRITFYVVNIESEDRKFEVEFQNEGTSGTNVYQFSEFTEKEGDSFTTTVPARGSKEFHIDIFGGSTDVTNDNLRLQADALNSEVSGEDSIKVDITDDPSSQTGQGDSDDSENVPGIGAIQLLFILLASAALFFSQS